VVERLFLKDSAMAHTAQNSLRAIFGIFGDSERRNNQDFGSKIEMFE
jgi:hypothetical protein